jgi:polar amino acid transport system substrate-binding protein
MNGLRLGVFVAATLLGAIGAANAQALKVGYGALDAPTTFLPNATADNFSTLDPTGDKAEGALVDLVNAIAKDSGFPVQFVAFGPGGNGGGGGAGGGFGVGGSGQTGALTGKDIDIIAGSPYSATNSAAVAALRYAVTKPIYATSEALLVSKTDTAQYKTWAELNGELVGTIVGTILDGPLQMSMQFKDVKTYDTLAEVAAAVTAGAVKAAIVPGAPNLAFQLSKGDFPTLQLVKTYQPKYVFNVALGVRTGDPLLAKIDASLAKLKANGTVKTIFAKYGVDSYLVP